MANWTVQFGKTDQQTETCWDKSVGERRDHGQHQALYKEMEMMMDLVVPAIIEKWLVNGPN